jgi:putative ABC transport system permease protein
VSPARLVLTNLLRNKRRTFLTTASVTVALFLFCALNGVIDTLDEAIKVGSETRLVTRNAVSLVFFVPLSYGARIAQVPGVRQVAQQNWFGAQDPNDRAGFFAQFAVDENFWRVYGKELDFVEHSPAPGGIASPGADLDPRLAAYFAERTAAVVGEGLMKKKGWKIGQTVTLAGTIYPGDWPFVIRAVYRPKVKALGDETMFFHWEYLYEGSNRIAQAGLYVLELDDPSRAGDIARAVDTQFENSSDATRTESERAFQAGFVSMYGNLPFVMRVVGMAVVFAILLIAANTMLMAFRERITEIGVLKTLGFSDRWVFGLVLTEAAIITLGGGIVGALGAKLLIEGGGFNAGGFLPPMVVSWRTVATGVAIALVIGAVSGLIPAWQALRLRIVQALRRV